MAFHILIIGGGIGGLSAAIALRRAGVSVAVYERAAQFGEAGAGVTMTPPGLRAMDALGLGEEVIALSDNVARTAFYQWDTGEFIKTSEPAPGATIMDQVRVLHRTDLHKLLLERAVAAGAQVHTGHALADFAQDAQGVSARFANGQTARGDALIGADGLRSLVRGALLGLEAPRRTGIVAFRALLPRVLVADLMEDYESKVDVGANANFVRYTVRHGQVLNCVGLARSDMGGEENWSTPATRAEFKAHFAGWNAHVYALIDRIPEHMLFKWPLFDRDPIAEWRVGRVALLGDAAHPMLPFLGIGATMAQEDAVVLGASMAGAPSVEQGLAAYVAARQPRAAEVTHASRAQGEWIMGKGVADAFRQELKRNPVMDYDVRR
ncbi:MAG TPA: FAD-dependent monooxygenase [Novosphingobium sp.]|nr:FAD-dependent monooxygenase [Novosphingobium sp.]